MLELCQHVSGVSQVFQMFVVVSGVRAEREGARPRLGPGAVQTGDQQICTQVPGLHRGPLHQDCTQVSVQSAAEDICSVTATALTRYKNSSGEPE